MQHLTTEFQPMHALAPYLLAVHQRDLLEAAEIARRLRIASAARHGIPAWRRGLGGILAAAARSVDPSIDRRASGRGARAMAA
jgi:hypothetical protein